MISLLGCSPRNVDILTSNDGAAVCAGDGVRLCETFEDDMLSSVPWYKVEIHAGVFIDDSRAHGGRRSLLVQSEPAAADVVVQGEITETTSVPTPAFFARVFVFVAAPVRADGERIIALLQRSGPTDGPAVWLAGAGVTAGFLSDLPALAGQIEPLKWTCVEWQVNVGPAGVFRLWIEDEEIPTLRFDGNTDLSPTYGRFSLGAAIFGAHPPLETLRIWFDDVVLADRRIGCAS